jgi:hypothetical protein
MASFYNPYQKGPDFGQGIGDIANQIMQVLMMKKMFPGQQQQATLGQTPLGLPGGGGPMGGQFQQPPGQMPDQPFAQGGTMGQPQMDPKMLMLLMKLLGGGGMSGMGGGGMGGMMGGM